MNDYIKDIFARMDVQQIREFLLYGAEDCNIDNRPYSVRIKEGGDPMYKRLETLYTDESERDKAANDLSQALAAHDAVYMEIGIKAGARLIYQLLLEDSNYGNGGIE